MSQWFRFYNRALDDPKVQRLPGDTFKGWINLLCLASRNEGVLPEMGDIAFALRLTLDEAHNLIETLIKLGLIDEQNADLIPHNWDSLQFTSDKDPTSSKRKRRQREKQNVTGDVTRDISEHVTVDVTRDMCVTSRPPDTDTDTEQIQIQKDISLSETSSDNEHQKTENLDPIDEKPARTRKKRHAYSAAFEEFWNAYPTDPLMSKANAAKQFERLTEPDRTAALAAIQPFRDWISRQRDYRTLHAERFLSQRRFEGFAEQQGAAAQSAFGPLQKIFVREGGPQWDAWKRVKGSMPVTTVMRDGQAIRGWFFDTEFPESENVAA